MKTKHTLLLLTFLVLPIILPAQTGRRAEASKQEGPKDSIQAKPVPIVIKQWRLSPGYPGADSLALDTGLRKFDRYHPAYKNNLFSFHNGNLGLAAYPMYFFDRNHQPAFLLSRNYKYYQKQQEDLLFLNTTTPYTELYYTTSSRSRSKQTVDVLHGQNILPAWNISLMFGGIRSSGEYTNQETARRYYGFTTNFSRPHYELYAGLVSGSQENSENGGLLLDTSDIDNPVLAPNLNTAEIQLKDLHAVFAQTLKIGDLRPQQPPAPEDTTSTDTVKTGYASSWLDLTHRLDFTRRSHLFTEEIKGYPYQELYFDTLASYDSAYYASLDNAFYVRLRETRGFLPAGLELGIVHAYKKYYNFKSLLVPNALDEYQNLAVSAFLYRNRPNSLQFRFGGEYALLGYQQNNFKLSGRLSLPLRLAGMDFEIAAQARYQVQKPGYYWQQYYSNHHIWDQNLRNETRMTASASLRGLSTHSHLKAHVAMLSQYTYLDTTATPAQLPDDVPVAGLALEQGIPLGKFHLDLHLRYQLTDKDRELLLPRYMAYGSFYYQDWWFNVLHLQLGFNLQYFSAFTPPAYTFPISQYHPGPAGKAQQNPFVEAFANIRWKRAQIFLKFAQLQAAFYNDLTYDHTVAQYPLPPLTFTFGISWKFYN